VSKPLDPADPAFWMLEQGRKDPNKRSTTTVYKGTCYICRDPEFALMGMPLCYPCKFCKGHVPADDAFCDVCGKAQYDED
jgi:hypothetical protein